MKIELSVIIPTYNRGEIFNKTLKALCIALRNIESQIIVVNDYKKHDLKIEKQIKEVMIVNNPLQGAASARNFGFSISTGSIVLFLDDDMIVTENVIMELIDFTKKNDKKTLSPNWVYPTTINEKIKESKFGRFLISINYNTLKGWVRADDSWENKNYYKTKGIASYCFMLKRQDFIDLGGYNQTFLFAGAEDYDITKRLEKQMFEFYIATKLMIFHNENDRIELKDWLNRKRKNGYTQRNAVKIGYSEMAIQYKGLKLFLIKILWKFKSVLYMLAQAIPNMKLFDPIYLFFVKALTGIYIYAGYEIDHTKK